MRRPPAWIATAVLVGCAAEQHAHAPASAARPAAEGAPFVATSQRAFQDLMDEAMARMHAGMESAPRTGDPDRDFVTQMIPHHQGAIDMARALLVHGKDPGLQRLAKEILTDQQSEIDLMRAWLDGHPRAASPAGAPSKGTP